MDHELETKDLVSYTIEIKILEHLMLEKLY